MIYILERERTPEYMVNEGGKDGEKTSWGDCCHCETGVVHHCVGVHTLQKDCTIWF